MHFTWLFALYHNSRFLDPRRLASTQLLSGTKTEEVTVKAILPCTALAIVKTLEYCQLFNPLLPFSSRLFGKTITVINRSEVVGRPLAALLANDGARVFSIDLDGIQEFNRRAPASDGSTRPYHPYHVVRKTVMSIEECLAISDVVVSGVRRPFLILSFLILLLPTFFARCRIVSRFIPPISSSFTARCLLIISLTIGAKCELQSQDFRSQGWSGGSQFQREQEFRGRYQGEGVAVLSRNRQSDDIYAAEEFATLDRVSG